MPATQVVIAGGTMPGSQNAIAAAAYPLPAEASPMHSQSRVVAAPSFSMESVPNVVRVEQHVESPHLVRVEQAHVEQLPHLIRVEQPAHLEPHLVRVEQPHLVQQLPATVVERRIVEPTIIERSPVHAMPPTEVLREYIGIGEEELKEFENKILGLLERLAKQSEAQLTEQQVKIIQLEQDMAQMARMQQIQQMSKPEGSDMKEAQYQEMLNREMNKLINMFNMLSSSCEERFTRISEEIAEERRQRQADIDVWGQGHQARLVQLEDPSRFAEILGATAKLEESHGLHQQEMKGLTLTVTNTKEKTDELNAKTKQAFDKLAEFEVLMNASQLELKLNDTNRDMLIMKSELKEIANAMENHKTEFTGGMDEHRRLFQQQLVEHNQRWNDHLTNSMGQMGQGLQAHHLDELRGHIEQRLSEHSENHKVALDQHARAQGNAMAQQQAALDGQRAVLDSHRAEFDNHRSAFEEHRIAFDNHRGSLDEKFSGIRAGVDPTSFQEEIDVAFDRRMGAIEKQLRLFATQKDMDELKNAMGSVDPKKVQALVKMEIQELESLIADIRGQHDRLAGSHKELSGFRPQDLFTRCETIEKNHALFSDRLARAETNFNRGQVGANSAEIEFLKKQQQEHESVLSELKGQANQLVQAEMKTELAKIQMELGDLVEVEVRKIGNKDLETEILARTKNVAELHAKVGKEVAAVRKILEVYRSEKDSAPEIGAGGLTPKLEESLDQYIRALVSRDIQVERETRYTQVSELRAELQQLKAR